MKLPKEVVNLIQSHVIFDLSSSIGCTRFAQCINDTIGIYVSANTLKRAFGIIHSTSNTSQYTLDVIAKYIGYIDWDDFIKNDVPKTSDFNCNAIVSLNTVEIGHSVKFSYSPNRKVSMKSIGHGRFSITESINSKLHVGDIVTALQIVPDHPLEFTSVVRNGKDLGVFTAGIHDGITAIDIY